MKRLLLYLILQTAALTLAAQSITVDTKRGHISKDELYRTMPYPDGPVIPGGEIERLLETYPNLYCDISANSGLRALSRDTEYSKRFLARFSDRVLYGRDYYYNKHQEFLNSLGLDRDILDKIYFKNALRLIHES